MVISSGRSIVSSGTIWKGRIFWAFAGAIISEGEILASSDKIKFDRITKEGRKYAVLLGLISQRPSELSTTALSQCSNFLMFKMLHPLDIEYVSQMIPNMTSEISKKVKLLQPGTCIAFGSGFNLPQLVKLDMPNPSPSSSNCDISSSWFIDRN